MFILIAMEMEKLYGIVLCSTCVVHTVRSFSVVFCSVITLLRSLFDSYCKQKSWDCNRKLGNGWLAMQLSNTQLCNYNILACNCQLKHIQPNVCMYQQSNLQHIHKIILPLWAVLSIVYFIPDKVGVNLLDMLENALFVCTCIWQYMFELTVTVQWIIVMYIAQ